ncbi:MAG: hypothetical protein JW801_11780 [Bacteroidales bacterium]|nr:hypothetical protein [Bacteroidales bacterium]
MGSILFVAAVHEFLKHEWIEINNRELIIGNTIFGYRTSATKYLLKNISDCQLAIPPVRGWRVEEEYKDAYRWKKSYSNDIRKIYPTISFQYKSKEVVFANGLKHEEANEVINLIKKHIANES